MVSVDNDYININDANGEYTSGNNDGILNPGETVVIEFPVLTRVLILFLILQGVLSTNSDLIEVISGGNQYGDLDSQSSSYGLAYYLIRLDENFNEDTDYELRLNMFDSNGNSWASLVHPT